ncbi:MAG: HAD family hydrolase, partial [Candidatus Bathyarchaeota archaeon]
MDLKGVLVDFGDTLAHIDEENRTRYEEELLSTARKYGYQKDLDNLTSVLHNTSRNSHKGEIKDYQEFWGLFLKSLGIPEKSALTEKLEETRNRHLSTIFRLYAGATAVLSNLRRKYKLALVSNCAIGTFDIIKALGLVDFFDCVILSYEVK